MPRIFSRSRKPAAVLTSLAVVSTGALLFASEAEASASTINGEADSRVVLVDTVEIPALSAQVGTVFSGISGLDYDPENGSYLAISDDRSENGPARAYSLDLDFDDSGFVGSGLTVLGTTPLLGLDGNTFPVKGVDPESIRVSHDGGFWWTSEGASNSGVPAFIREADTDGAFTRELTLPDAFAPVLDAGKLVAGVRNNQALEALSYSADGKSLVAITENALVQDGPAASATATSPSRFVSIDVASGLPQSQYVYPVSVVPYAPTAPLPAPINVFSSDRGASEMLQLSSDEYLVLERSFASGVGYQAQIFIASTEGATEVSGEYALSGDETPMTKTLMFDLNETGARVDNIEGMTWGPDFSDGSRSLILVADDNFGFVGSNTQFHLLKVPAAAQAVPPAVTPAVPPAPGSAAPGGSVNETVATPSRLAATGAETELAIVTAAVLLGLGMIALRYRRRRAM
jgi:hypothetical protein